MQREKRLVAFDETANGNAAHVNIPLPVLDANIVVNKICYQRSGPGAKLDLPQGFRVDAGVQLFPVSVLLAWNQPLNGDHRVAHVTESRCMSLSTWMIR